MMIRHVSLVLVTTEDGKVYVAIQLMDGTLVPLTGEHDSETAAVQALAAKLDGEPGVR